MNDGTSRNVPPPSERLALTRRVHEDAGHFGRRRTAHLLRTNYWWFNTRETVELALKECSSCDRIKAAFKAPSPVLHCLPIEGLFYRWGVDLFGPFDTSKRGNNYVMVCIEHYSKWAEVIAIPDKSATTCAVAFRQAVLGRFGGCAEVLTDCGTEWLGAFETLLQSSLIDHRTTSPDRPQANGLTERAVQTFKRCLRTYADARDQIDTWDDDVPYVQLGYNSASQTSTKLSPMRVLYGRDPTIPPAKRERLEPPLPLQDEGASDEELLHALLQRVATIKEMGVTIGDNLRIAQQRDSLRYALKRGGEYAPMVRKFAEGDYVYVRAHKASRRNLDSHVHPVVRRVLRVGVAGTLKVQAPDGTVAIVHAENAAPCHLPQEPWQLNAGSMRQGHSTQACMGCNHTDMPDTMLLCDACGQGWHMSCLHSPLVSLPASTRSWRCESCVELNVPAQEWEGACPSTLPRRSNAARRQMLEDDRLTGRFIKAPFAYKKTTKLYWGIVYCRGPAKDCKNRENYLVDYSDGEQCTCNHAFVLQHLQPIGAVWPTSQVQPPRLPFAATQF